MNVYHDGKEGIAQHFDDAVRFKQVCYHRISVLTLYSLYSVSVSSQILVYLSEANSMAFVMERFVFQCQEAV